MRRPSTIAVTRSTSSASIESWTSTREFDPHDWPCEPMKFIPATTPAAAFSRSASGSTIIAFLPPSSSVTVFTPAAAASAWIARPTRSEPMKARRLTSGCALSAWPTPGPSPLTTLSTPAGSRSLKSSPIRSADSGVWSAGLRTTAFPAISGAATLPAAKKIGWLNGTIRPTTPNGSRTV